MADGILLATGQTVATREITQYNGVSVTTRHAELAALVFDLGGGAAAAVGRGQQTKAVSVPVALASDDALLQVLPASRGNGGGMVVEALAPSIPISFLSAGSVIAQQLKGSPGIIYYLQFFKATAGSYWVRLYDKVGVPAFTDTPKERFKVTDTAPVVVKFEPGDGYVNGIGIRITAGAADSDNAGVAANEAQGNLGYL